MLPIISPSSAAGRSGDDFIVNLYWRKNPVLERIQSAIVDNTCGELSSLRFTWSRAKRFATSEKEFIFDSFSAVLDGAQRVAQSEFKKVYLEKVPGVNILFALAEFENGIVAEFEFNEHLPETMPDICFIKANFSHGHVTNQPLVGYFNEEGMVYATDDELEFPITENFGIPLINGPIEQMKYRFQCSASMGEIAPGNAGADQLIRLIEGALL
jgi:hypothetical protein